jgi:hypothetical protein
MHATFFDIIHEAMELGNKDRVQSILQKIDDDSVKAQGLMSQAHEVMVAAHKDCMSAIRQLFDGILPFSFSLVHNPADIFPSLLSAHPRPCASTKTQMPYPAWHRFCNPA